MKQTDANLRRADQLALLTQGPPPDGRSVPPWGQTAGVGPWETEHFSATHERARSPIFSMIRFLFEQNSPGAGGFQIIPIQGTVGELGIKKGRGLLDLSHFSDILVFSLEPATPAASISTTAIATTTRAGGLGFGFVDRQRSATKLCRV